MNVPVERRLEPRDGLGGARRIRRGADASASERRRQRGDDVRAHVRCLLVVGEVRDRRGRGSTTGIGEPSVAADQP